MSRPSALGGTTGRRCGLSDRRAPDEPAGPGWPALFLRTSVSSRQPPRCAAPLANWNAGATGRSAEDPGSGDDPARCGRDLVHRLSVGTSPRVPRGQITETGMRSHCIARPAPALDRHLRLAPRGTIRGSGTRRGICRRSSRQPHSARACPDRSTPSRCLARRSPSRGPAPRTADYRQSAGAAARSTAPAARSPESSGCVRRPPWPAPPWSTRRSG